MGVDLADMQLISKFNKGFRFLLCFIDIFSKYVWAVPLKDKKRASIVNAFQKFLDESTDVDKQYIDKLDDIVDEYNNKYHRTT